MGLNKTSEKRNLPGIEWKGVRVYVISTTNHLYPFPNPALHHQVFLRKQGAYV